MALLHSGRSTEGEAACREVLTRRDDPQREGTLRWLLIRSMVIRDQVAESLVQIDEALAQRTASQAERALYHAWAALARLRLGQYDPALELAEHAVELAAPTGDSVAISETCTPKRRSSPSAGTWSNRPNWACRPCRRRILSRCHTGHSRRPRQPV